jgi:hypothetical protein
MKREGFCVFLVLLLSTSLLFSMGIGFGAANTQTPQDDVTLDLQHFTWNHADLRVLVITEKNASWWRSYYVDSARRAVGIWNDAFQEFAANYSDFAYIKALSMTPTFSDTVQTGFDIYVSWTTEPISGGGDNVGLSLTYSVSGIVVNSSVSLAVDNSLGIALDEVEIQNIALHELGHSLGLNHCSSVGDIMYPASLLGTPAQGVSTLDTCGVAKVFGWLSNSSKLTASSSEWPPVSSVHSPSDVAYGFLPLSSANLPPLSILEPIIGPVRFVVEVILLYVPLYLLFVIFVAVIALTVVSLVYRRRKKKSPPVNS